MAEEHLSTTPGEQKEPGDGEKVELKDFSSEVGSQVNQLISLSELLRKLEDAGPGEMRVGCFNGLADIIEGCADRIESMVSATYDYMYDFGEMRALEKAKKAWDGEAAVLRITARDIEAMAAYLIKLRHEPEFDQQAEIFTNGLGVFRIHLNDFLEKAFAPVKEGEGLQAVAQAPEIPKLKKVLSRAHLAHIEAIRRNLDARAERLIYQDKESPLTYEEVVQIGQEIRNWAVCIKEDIAI